MALILKALWYPPKRSKLNNITWLKVFLVCFVFADRFLTDGRNSSKSNERWSFPPFLLPFHFLHSDPIAITIQAFLQDNEVVPLSMTHQPLYVSVETQVAIAGIILAGVYVLIIFEVNSLWCSRSSTGDERACFRCLWKSLKCETHSSARPANNNDTLTQEHWTACVILCYEHKVNRSMLIESEWGPGNWISRAAFSSDIIF